MLSCLVYWVRNFIAVQSTSLLLPSAMQMLCASGAAIQIGALLLHLCTRQRNWRLQQYVFELQCHVTDLRLGAH